MIRILRKELANSTPNWIIPFLATPYSLLHPNRTGSVVVYGGEYWLLKRMDGLKILKPESRLGLGGEPYEHYFSVESGDTVLDVGACIGEFSIPASKKAEKVISVEASPRNLDYLKLNIEINEIKNIEVVEKAACSGKETLTLHFDENNIGGNSIINEKSGGSVKVEADTLDNIVKK